MARSTGLSVNLFSSDRQIVLAKIAHLSYLTHMVNQQNDGARGLPNRYLSVVCMANSRYFVRVIFEGKIISRSIFGRFPLEVIARYGHRGNVLIHVVPR